ncbi:MAG: hypothetical protein WBE45_21325 [Terriglobales bacterium]|jgi:hypothetical protein
MPKKQDFTIQPYNLSKYENAFELLGQGGNWKYMVPPIARQIMIWTALNLNFDQTNEIEQDILALFTSTGRGALDTTNVMNCLREIRRIGE